MAVTNSPSLVINPSRASETVPIPNTKSGNKLSFISRIFWYKLPSLPKAVDKLVIAPDKKVTIAEVTVVPRSIRQSRCALCIDNVPASTSPDLSNILLSQVLILLTAVSVFVPPASCSCSPIIICSTCSFIPSGSATSARRSGRISINFSMDILQLSSDIVKSSICFCK